MIKIAIFNQKGGVAKTTTAVNIAASLVKFYNKKVLTVNCDSQVTLHQFLLTYTNPDNIKTGTVKDLFQGTDVGHIATDICVLSGKDIYPIKMSVIPSEKDVHLWDVENGDKANNSLNRSDYDYCIFDLPPHLSGISIAALSICDYIIVPAIPDMDSLIGFEDIVKTVGDIRNNGGNPDLAILGVVFCKVEPYMTHSYIMDQIRSEMGDLCFNSCIKNRSVMEQARFYGTPVCYFSPKCEATSEYRRLVGNRKENFKRQKRKEDKRMAKKDLSKAPNSNLLKKITESGNASANAKTTMDIDVSLIDENPDNARIFNMNEIERLASSIKKEGFAGAIEVYKKDNGRFEISSGHRRVRAVKLLGIKTIPAIVSSMPENEVIRRTALLSSNINNRDMTPMDYARAIDYHEKTLRLKYGTGNSNRTKKNSGIDINNELAEYFGLNVHTVKRYKNLVRLIPELQMLIEERKLPYTSLEGAHVLSEKDQKTLFRDIQKELKAVGKLDRSLDDNENILPAYVVKRLVDSLKNEDPSDAINASTTRSAGTAPSNTDHETKTSISDNLVSDASFFADYNYDTPMEESKNERYDTHFDNFFALIDSFMTLDISSINKKRKTELKKKLEKIIAML